MEGLLIMLLSLWIRPGGGRYQLADAQMSFGGGEDVVPANRLGHGTEGACDG